MTKANKDKNMWFLTLTAGIVCGLIIALILFWYYFKDTFR